MNIKALTTGIAIALAIAGTVVLARDIHQTTGTSSIVGSVVDDQDPARPVTRAIVTVAGAALASSRSVVTDDSGRFRVDRLPAGRFTLKAEKPTYVTSAFGSKRPARSGTMLALEAGANADVTLKLWRGAVISGTIRNELGQPLRGITVRAVRDGGAADPALPVLTSNGTTTDHQGEFRIFGLEPGEYVVSASAAFVDGNAAETLTDARVDALLAQLRQGRRTAVATTAAIETADRQTSFSPMFYPGTPAVDEATVLRISPGQEIPGIDIRFVRSPVSAVTGIVRTQDGSPAAGALVQLYRLGKATRFATIRSATLSANAGADGSFRVVGAPLGSYRLTARYAPPATPTAKVVTTTASALARHLWAWTELTVAGRDVTDVALSLGPGITISGNVVFDAAEGTTGPLPDLNNIIIGAVSAATRQSSLAYAGVDRTFTINGAYPDSYNFSVVLTGVDSSWTPRSAIADGRDLLDGPADFGRETSVTVTLTNKRSELVGNLRTAEGTPVADVFIIAFASDRRLWGVETRRVQAVRPGVDGAFSFRNLPAGEYFLGALMDVDQGDWLRSGFLESVVAAAMKVTVADGQKTVQDLQIGR